MAMAVAVMEVFHQFFNSCCSKCYCGCFQVDTGITPTEGMEDPVTISYTSYVQVIKDNYNRTLAWNQQPAGWSQGGWSAQGTWQSGPPSSDGTATSSYRQV